jgi:hypothetical protein
MMVSRHGAATGIRECFTFVDFLLLRLGQGEECFETIEDFILNLCRDVMADNLKEAIVQAAFANLVHELSLRCCIVAIENFVLRQRTDIP